jgi:hypothetical protein
MTPETTTLAGPGDFFYAGPGHVHSFANRGDRPARALCVQTPGVDAEKFFESIAAAGAKPGFDPMRDLPGIATDFGIAIEMPRAAQAA